jgi:hypothetical protein
MKSTVAAILVSEYERGHILTSASLRLLIGVALLAYVCWEIFSGAIGAKLNDFAGRASVFTIR